MQLSQRQCVRTVEATCSKRCSSLKPALPATAFSNVVRLICWPLTSFPTSTFVSKHQSCIKSRSQVVANSTAQQTVFFIDSEEGFRLPLEPQQLLGLQSGQVHKDSVVNNSYDELLTTPLEPGYSAQIATGRAEVLEIVRTILITSKNKPLDRRDKEVLIPYDLLPGALALLAELCFNDLVMYLGGELLATGELDSYKTVKHDVLLSMALAKCNMARDELEAGVQVAAGCKHLEEALSLLQPLAGPTIAPDLAKDIRASLNELHGQAALEQVSGPITKESAEERKRAVRTLRDLLKQTDVDLTALASVAGSRAVSPISPDFMSKLISCLTLEEAVFLVEWETVARHVSSHKWVYPGLLERIAIGHVLLGFQQCQPAYIKMALQVLRQLQPSSTVMVSQAICHVLLGSVNQSMELLKQAEAAGSRERTSSPIPAVSPRPGSPSSRPLWGPQAHAYVVANTPSGEDGYLPGLCQFTELWLGQLAAPMWRDTVDHPPHTGLSKYFDNTHVEALITVYDEQGEQLEDKVSHMLGNLRQGLRRIKEVARKTLPLPPAVETALAIETNNSSPNLKKVIPAAVVGALAVGAFLIFGRKPSPAQPAAAAVATPAPAATSAAVVATPAAVKVKPVVDSSATLSPAVAEKVLWAWQSVKSRCLGCDYDTSSLSCVLAEPVLGEVKSKVEHFKKQSWYMQYKLHQVKVRDIDSSSPGVTAVRAVLEESATLMETGGRQVEHYKSEYEATYHMVKGSDGAWRVSQLTVQEK